MALITTETARQMAARSAESRRLNPLRAVPPGYKLVPTDYPEHVPASDDYPAVVLARTRTQLDLVAQRILDELAKDKPDSRRLRDLSDAQRHLAEQERILAGRPLPGSRKPPPDRSPRNQEHGAWIIEEPPRPPPPALPAPPPADDWSV